MAMRGGKFARARQLARRMLWECGIDEASKIDPLVLVGRLGIVVIYGSLDGATAQIFRYGDRAVMRVSNSIVQLGRRNFTIAHELGHFLLGHSIPSGTEQESIERTASQEREADVFAAELLMPEDLVAPHVALPASLATVRSIGDTFRTSIVASAMRYVELTPTSCALVYSKDGRVVWAKHSRSFPGRIPHQIRIGSGAIASDLCTANGNSPLADERVVPASAWFAAETAPDTCVSFVEHATVVPEPGWGGVLSLLAQAA